MAVTWCAGGCVVLAVTIQGFCGVRFNPYLWAQGGAGMRDETGLALYRKAGELGMPVGVMCFKGFGLHVEEIEALLRSSPETKVRCIHRCCFLFVFVLVLVSVLVLLVLVALLLVSALVLLYW